MAPSPKHGFLCLNKSRGITSRDAVNVVQRLVKPAKVGHAGTLDPLATGVLVVAIGKATRLVSSVQNMEKQYVARFELGCTSDTEDITGKVVREPVSEEPTPLALEAACQRFVGEIQQRPPSFSALKVKGKRAYEMAREGKKVKLDARPIVIHSITTVRYRYPEFELDVVCGSGTYIRSLGRDIGDTLGCGAVMSGLIRTRIGKFHLESAVDVESLNTITEVQASLLPMLTGVDLPKLRLSDEQQQAIQFGREIACDVKGETFAATNEHDELLAVMKRVDGKTTFRPAVNLVAK